MYTTSTCNTLRVLLNTLQINNFIQTITNLDLKITRYRYCTSSWINPTSAIATYYEKNNISQETDA